MADATKGYTPPEGEPKNERICPHCFTKNAEFAEFCTHCGRSLGAQDWHSVKNEETSYSPFRAASFPMMSVEEQELSAIVGVNAQYYLPRFQRIRQGLGGGWNWAAFFLGPLWLFYRKQYLLGCILFAFQMIFDIATMWLMNPINTATTEAEIIAVMEQMMENPMMFPAMFLSFLLLFAHLLLGAKGNQLYRHHCTKRIAYARQQVPDLSATELVSFGGVSVGASVIAYLLSSLLVNGFATFLMM